jgi:hypothetical protein
MQHGHPLPPCELDRERWGSLHPRHHNVFDGIMPAVAKHVWDHNVWVCGKLMQEEHLLFQTGPGAQTMRPLDLQHEVVIKHIGTSLSTCLIDAGDCRAAHAMATHDVQHRPLIQHRISGVGLAVCITG